MTKEEVQQQLKNVKRSLHLGMNGVASQSMREKGLSYQLNWGVSLTQLREMAAEYTPDYHLAVELWKEDIRECKILATMLMPPEEMPLEVVDVWMEQTTNQEVAEMAVFNLYQHLKDAPALAFEWMASTTPIRQLSGFLLLGCLFRNKQEPNERGINEFLDQVQVTLAEGELAVRHAAQNCLNRFCELGSEYEQLAAKALPDFI